MNIFWRLNITLAWEPRILFRIKQTLRTQSSLAILYKGLTFKCTKTPSGTIEGSKLWQLQQTLYYHHYKKEKVTALDVPIQVTRRCLCLISYSIWNGTFPCTSNSIFYRTSMPLGSYLRILQISYYTFLGMKLYFVMLVILFFIRKYSYFPNLLNLINKINNYQLRLVLACSSHFASVYLIIIKTYQLACSSNIVNSISWPVYWKKYPATNKFESWIHKRSV